MDEYITWSDELKQFGDNITLKELLKDICETWDVYEVEEGKYFRNIGLKDINGKSIYADSSIVEFQWINGFGNVQTDWGVFKYDIDYLQYLIYEENEDINKSSIKDVLNIKIIDTIQENKLGLI